MVVEIVIELRVVERFLELRLIDVGYYIRFWRK